MLWRYSPLICSLVCIHSAHALVESRIDEEKPLTASFSNTSHNRISVKEGSVEKIFGNESLFHITLDRTTGNAFINVLQDIIEPTTLTVVTSTGLIQDIRITSASKPSEHLLLYEIEEDREDIPTDSNFHGPTVEFLNQLLKGKTPLGYGSRPLVDTDTLPLPEPLSAATIKAFEGPFEEILVYSITNKGKSPIIIDAQPLKKGSMSWVFLNAHELKSREQALCIVAHSKEGS